MTIDLVEYLGRPIGDLLAIKPISKWLAKRTVRADPALEFWYQFEGHGFEVTCDAADRIRSLFFRRGDGESLIGIPFTMSRNDLLGRFGTPSKSGAPVRLPGLGDVGGWDRFILPQGTIHFQYHLVRDEIDLITLMRQDAVP